MNHLDLVHITEVAAIASSSWVGRGDAMAADQAAVNAMRKAFDSIDIDGVVVIGEGERDQAPMLFIGEKVGQCKEHSPQVDIAVDPLEGTNLCAEAKCEALSVLAVGKRGHFLHAPDTYMNKIAVGPKASTAITQDQQKDKIHIKNSPTQNIMTLSKYLEKPLHNLTIGILDRPRHKDLIAEVRDVGARIHLFDDGDVAVAIETSQENSGIDMLLGIGGAPEGVLAAAALKCLGGNFQGQLEFRKPQEKDRAIAMGMKNPDQVLSLDDLVYGDVLFVATGVTDGFLLKGVSECDDKIQTSSMLLCSQTGTLRYIDALHKNA